MAEKKEIKDMNIQEMRDELKLHCSCCSNCSACVLSGINRLDDINTFHKGIAAIDDRYTLGLMIALIRGYLVWDESRNPDNRKESDTGSNVPEQPTVPPMPEPVELLEAKVSELSVDVPDDMTVIMISGKKPTSMTVFYDQEGGGADGT